MAFTLTPAYSWSDGDLVTAVRLGLTATPTLADGQTYTFGAGSAAAPSWNFTGYTTTGLYAAAPGIGFAVAGASVGTWTASALTVNKAITISGNGSLAAGTIYGDATGGLINVCKTGATYDWSLVDTSGNTIITVPTGTRDVTLFGTLRLGSPYVGTPVSTTGYIVVKDSAGVTYKIMVST